MKRIISAIAAFAVTIAISSAASAYDLPSYKTETKNIAGEGYEVSTLQQKLVDGKPYTGFTKTKIGTRYYYINGIKQGGVLDIKNKRYVFTPDTGKCLGYRTLDKNKSIVLRTAGSDVQLNDIETDRLEYTIALNGFTEAEAQKYTFGEHFSLYKYFDGKWQSVPMKDNWGFTDIGYIATGKTPAVTISGFFKMFDYKFTDGLYRIKATYTSGSGGYPPQGTLKTYTVSGEFNLMVSPSAYANQINDEETIKTMYSLKTDKTSYSTDFDKIQATLTNINAGSVGCGYSFRVEKQVGNKWETVEMNAAFIMPYIALNVGDIFNGYVLRSDMLPTKPEKGEYRLVTDIQVEGNNVEAAAPFSIV